MADDREPDALEHLELAGPLSQRDLVARLLLSSGSVSTLVDRLERAGLVVRTPHPVDRRSTLVQLAPSQAMPKTPDLEEYYRAARAAADKLPVAARADLITFLTAMADQADATTAALRERRSSSRR